MENHKESGISDETIYTINDLTELLTDQNGEYEYTLETLQKIDELQTAIDACIKNSEDIPFEANGYDLKTPEGRPIRNLAISDLIGLLRTVDRNIETRVLAPQKYDGMLRAAFAARQEEIRKNIATLIDIAGLKGAPATQADFSPAKAEMKDAA